MRHQKAPKCMQKRQNDPKKPSKRPKTTPSAPPKGPQSDQKSKPNRKTKKGPNQDDPKTVLDPPRAICVAQPPPPGLHLGGQNGTKTDPKTIKNRREKSRGEETDPRRSWTRDGAILGRLGCSLGALEPLQTLCLPMFRENSLFRC